MFRVGLGGLGLLGLAIILSLWATVSETTENDGDSVPFQSSKTVQQPTSFVTSVYRPGESKEKHSRNSLVGQIKEKRRWKRIKRDVADSEGTQLRPPNYQTQARTPLRLTPPQSFLRYFDVKLDTIIRTHDSRSLGAEYLNETEKPSNNDCLLWCWETPRCNVAVFADKNPGSCYLFDCGPVTSFRCRFTSHGNYKSSILQPPSQTSSGEASGPYDFAQWKSQVSHENELASLRGNRLSTVSPTFRPTMGAPPKSEEELAIRYDATVRPQMMIAPSDNPPTTKQENKGQSRCKHYQFPCRKTEECIAIYNVCDGIPQCPDGSDEAEDLHCPKSNNPLDPAPKTESPIPAALPFSTSAPYSRVAPPPIRDKPILHSTSLARSKSHPSAHRLPKTDTLESGEDRSRIGGSNLDREMAYQKELLESHLNRRPSIGSDLTEKQLDESRSDGGNWNPAANYPVRDVLRDSEDYVPNRDSEGSGFVPAQSPRTFSGKHSSFVAANSGTYRQQASPLSNQSPQWNTYNDNGEARAPSLDNTNPQRSPALSDLEYNRYEPPLYREGAANDGGLNMDAVYRHQTEMDSSGGGPNYNRYRNDEQRYWPSNADQQILKYPPKEESQMMSADLETHAKPSSLLSGYRDSLNGGDRGVGPLSYKGHREDNAYELTPSKSRHQIPVYPESVNARIAHDHGPIVQPQVQNDENPEDAIYEPRAELQPVRNTMPPKDNFMKARTATEMSKETTTKPSLAIKSTVKASATSELKTGGHQLQSSIHPNPVAGSRAVSLISAESGMTIAELKRSSRVHARESNSAVLALSLGLCVTAVLLVLVGCRMRNIRKRLARRGRSSLTHDADYLVNGMYL